MSGRVRVTLPDGRRVTGFRKTARVNRLADRSHAAPHVAPDDFRLSFTLPDSIGFAVADGPSGVIGVTVGPRGFVQVVGKNLEWVLRQAAIFLDRVSSQQEASIPAILTRGDDVSASGPTRRGYRSGYEFVVVRAPSVIVAQPYDQPLIFPAKG